MQKICMDGQCIKNCPWMVFNGWNLSKFNEDFIKEYDENSNKGYFLKVDVEYPKTLFNSHKDLPFLPDRKKKN